MKNVQPEADAPASPMSPATAPCVLLIPDHTLIRRIARGAYGEVWLARNAVGTLRAVKIVRRDQHGSVESFEREFKGLQKFEPLSRSHEGFVDILTLGLLPHEAGFYYVMELADRAEPRLHCEAANATRLTSSEAEFQSPKPRLTSEPEVAGYEPRTLRAELKARDALPADEVIALGLKLTAALAHLHAHGLVHRDVKPSNILFIGGEPKLADAGLVTAVDDARSLVGTAGYIAPEGPGTPQADLYALGKVLYEAAFGKDRQEFPALPGNIASRSDHASLLELNCVLLKACATNPKDRYPAAEEMRAELALLTAGRSLIRRQVRRRLLTLAKNVILGAGIIAVMTALVLSGLKRRSAPSDVVWSKKSEEANEAYRKGMALLHKGTSAAVLQAQANFRHATEMDERFAAAHARLAEACIWIGAPAGDVTLLRQARSEAEKAIALDPNSVTGHGCLGSTIQLLDHDWKKAEKELSYALKLSPDSEDTLYQYANCLVVAGEAQRAVQLVERALRQDSHSAALMHDAGWVFYVAHKYDRAVKKFEELYQQEPSTLLTGLGPQLVAAYRESGDYPKAIEIEKKIALSQGGDTNATMQRFELLKERFEQGGAPAYWRQLLEWNGNDKSNPLFLAELYARVGDQEKALDCLDEVYKQTPSRLVLAFNTTPGFESLRSNPRFAALQKALSEHSR